MPESPVPTPVEPETITPPQPRRWRKVWRFADALILVWVALVAYWPAVRGGLLWDDDAHLTRYSLRSLEGLGRIWFHLGDTAQYYPLLHSAFWLESRLWGTSMPGYHVWNVVLHGVSAYLVVLIVRRLGLPGAWLAALVFALHPVCVESVAWVSEQKSTLSGVFYLASALTYLHFCETRRSRQYWAALGLFVMALLSKSVTATLPAVLLVVLWWRHGRLEWKRDIRPLTGWLAIGAGAGMFTSWVERTFVGAEGAQYILTPVQHILLAGRVVWFYAGKVVWPTHLLFNYPHWDLNPRAWWQYQYPAALAAVAVVCVLMARRNRGPLAALLIYVGTLTPVLGFLNVYPFRYSYVADHFQYLAALAIIVPTCSLLALAARRASLRQPAAAALASILVLSLGALTWRQAHLYSGGELLYRATLRENPESYLVLTCLCADLLNRPDRLADAVNPCQRSLAMKPDMVQVHVNMGALLEKTGDMPGAIHELQIALQMYPKNPVAHFDLANALLGAGRTVESLEEFQAALKIDPYNPMFYLSYASALRTVPGRLQDALGVYENALQVFPCSAETLYEMGATLAHVPGRSLDAIDNFEKALECQPGYPPARAALAELNPGKF